MAEMTARDAKLIQYLNEAYGKEKELETSLKAHISMTTRAPYKKRLQEHLRETKRHAKELERRIKKLGGKAEAVDTPGPEAIAEATSAMIGAARKAMAAAMGPMHMLRGTGEQEKMLKNAKTQFWNEAEEIATYRAIITLAEQVGDTETTKLAKSILREEERMQRFLERLIPQLAKAVVTEEIPPAERDGARRRRTARSRNGSRRTAASRSGSSRSTAAKSSSGRSTAARGKSTSTRSSRSRASGGRSRSTTGSRATASS